MGNRNQIQIDMAMQLSNSKGLQFGKKKASFWSGGIGAHWWNFFLPRQAHLEAMEAAPLIALKVGAERRMVYLACRCRTSALTKYS